MRTATARRRMDAGTPSASSRLAVRIDGQVRCTASEAFAREYHDIAVETVGAERVEIHPEHTIDLTT